MSAAGAGVMFDNAPEESRRELDRHRDVHSIAADVRQAPAMRVSESADGFTARACLRRWGIRAVEFILVEAARGQPSSGHTGLPRAFRRHDTPGTRGSVVPRRARARQRGHPTLHASPDWERPGPAPARSPRRLREASPLRHLHNWTCCNLRCSRSFDYSIVSNFDSKISTGRHDEPSVPGDRRRRLR